jgi:hypothetical protein
MKESYRKGVATHLGPESWGDVREGVTQALTGVHAGQVSSREILLPGRRRGSGLGRQHEQWRNREPLLVPARSQTLCMHGTLHAREPGDPLSRPLQMAERAASGRQSRSR